MPGGIIAPMELVLIENIEAWGALQPAWNQLMERSGTANPFLEYWYLRTWWEHLGGGEWPVAESRLAIAAGYEDGVLKAIAPFFISQKEGHPTALRFIGQIEVTDYLDFIAEEGALEEFLSALFDLIFEQDRFGVKKVSLANLRNGSPSLPVLARIAEEKGLSYEAQILQPAPVISLPRDWEDYLQSLSKKQRHEMRRKERNAEQNFDTRLVFAPKDADIEQEMREFLELMRNEVNKQQFLSEGTENFLIDLAHKANQRGKLLLCHLYLNGEKAAAYFTFLSDRKLLVYNTGWNPRFLKASPGWVLLGKLVRWAIENGLDEVDLMRGDEDYKYRFGAQDRHVVGVVIGPQKA